MRGWLDVIFLGCHPIETVTITSSMYANCSLNIACIMTKLHLNSFSTCKNNDTILVTLILFLRLHQHIECLELYQISKSILLLWYLHKLCVYEHDVTIKINKT